MPRWEDLTDWLKAQLVVMSLHEWGLQTFTIHLHPSLEEQWTASGADPRIEIRNRMRREFQRLLGPKREYFFVIEGWSKLSKSEVRLHIHGGAFIQNPGEEAPILEAAARSCGQGVRGKPIQSRAVHEKVYHREGDRYINYLFKSVRRKDARLSRKRIHLSREAVGAGREMWKLVTGAPFHEV